MDSPAPAIPPTEPVSTVIVRATRDEAAGALRRVAGLPVVERAVRQLARLPGVSVVVQTDGTFPLPTTLPATATIRRIDPGAEVGAGGATVVRGDVVRRQGEPLDAGARVVDEATRRAAEDSLFADLLRGDLGFVARHLNKKISFRITRYLLCRLPVTPNQVTIGAAIVGLLGCALIATGGYAAMVTGLVLAQLQSVLDGCDGELARVRFQQSAIGEWLDTIVDDLMNLALVASLGIGLWRAGSGVLTFAGAGAAFAMFLFYNVVSYRELLRQGVGGELIKIRWKLAKGRNMKTVVSEGTGGGAVALVLALGRRDTFVLGWLFLAVVGLPQIAVLWAVLASGACFAAALGQVLVPDVPGDAVSR